MIKLDTQILKEITNRLVAEFNPEKIILFGSATTDSAIKPNDFDLLVIKNTKMPRLRRRAEVLKNVEYNIPLDLIVLTPNEIKRLLDFNNY